MKGREHILTTMRVIYAMYSRRRHRSGKTSTCVGQGWRCTLNVCLQPSLDSASLLPLSTSH